MKKNPSKEKVIQAASTLFFHKGFHGTTVRDIAERAQVNVSAISYYFKSKQGLLEYAVTNYYEEYLEVVEKTMRQSNHLPPIEKLEHLVSTIIRYKHTNFQLTSFIQRELSLDSVFVREMTVTYLAKENFYLRKTFFEALGTKVKIDEKHYLLMQLKGMLVTPYILHNDWKDQVIGDYSHQIFIKKYVKMIQNWLHFTMMNVPENQKKVAY